MRAFIGLAGLTFLSLALLAATGRREVWHQHVAPTIEPKLAHPTYVASNAAVEKIFANNSAGLIAFASLYAVWQVSGAVRAVMDALKASSTSSSDRTRRETRSSGSTSSLVDFSSP
jgi:uncharacterized BrkB/YihY/UPF0761 family membrane protein